MEAVCKPIGKTVQENGRYYIQLERQFANGLLRLEEFSHIQVVCWFHQSDNEKARECLVIDQPYRNEPDTIGVFATRSENRPNPIAITACVLLSIDVSKCRIEVNYIDAFDATPVLDIKPYHPSSDKIRDVVMPAWCAQLPECYEDSGSFDWSTVFNFE